MPLSRYHHAAPGQEDVFLSGALVFPAHLHRGSEQWIQVLHGRVDLTVQGSTFALQAGQGMHVPALTVHSMAIPEGAMVRTRSCSMGNIPKPPHFAGSPLSKLVDPLDHLAALMADRPEHPYPLAAMGCRLGLSPWQVIRKFRQRHRITPHAFLVACRVSLVRLLLRQGLDAVDAALVAGFSDQSHMCRVFRLHHQLSPRQFLRCQEHG